MAIWPPKTGNTYSSGTMTDTCTIKIPNLGAFDHGELAKVTNYFDNTDIRKWIMPVSALM